MSLDPSSRAALLERIPGVFPVDHPLVQHKISSLRRAETQPREFRSLVEELGTLVAYEATRDLQLETVPIETPLETAECPVLAGKNLCIVSIMRAGNGLLEGVLKLAPDSRVGHVGLYRDPKTKRPIEYYTKLPHALGERTVLLVDPMLATGHSAAAAAHKLVEMGASRIRFVCLFAAPEGIELFKREHPDIPIYAAVIDRGLDDNAYIRPGVGDAGDRIYGTQ